jgi:hypothetical protein
VKRARLPAVDLVRAKATGVDVKHRPRLAASIRARVHGDVTRILADFGGHGIRDVTELTTFYLAGKVNELELSCNALRRAKP